MKLVFIIHLLLFPSTMVRLGFFLFSFFLSPFYLMNTQSYMIGRELRKPGSKRLNDFNKVLQLAGGSFPYY